MATEKRRPPGYEARTLDSRTRQDSALQLRLAGATWKKVAEGAGYSTPANAHRAVMNALDRIPKNSAEQYLAEELERLNRLTVAYWTKALSGDDKAATIILRVSERRAKLLGLDHTEARIADALQASVLLEADKQQRLTHAVFTALTQAGIDADTQYTITQHLDAALMDVGIIPREIEA